MIVFLDRDSLDDYLPHWQAMELRVDIWFLGRGIDYLGGQKHWAWLILGSKFLCTIEFGSEGIVVQYFKRDRGIKIACSSIMGNDDDIYYSDKYTTRMTFAEILEYVVTLNKSWRADHYNGIQKNCRDFVRTLGQKMDAAFKPSETFFNFLIDDTSLFPHSIKIA